MSPESDTASPARPTVAPSSGAGGVPTLAEARRLEAVAPGTLAQVLAVIDANERHRRRLDLADRALMLTGQLCGLIAVAVLAAVSWHYVDRGAATQGAAVIGTGAVGIVAVFVTGRLAGSRQARSEDDAGGD